MDFLVAVGQVIRKARLDAGLNLEACAGVINRDHLRRAELGQVELGLRTFERLCRLLQVRPAHVLLIAQAQLDDVASQDARSESNRELRQLLNRGRFAELTAEDRQLGPRGVRANANREAVLKMQGSGHTKAQTARELGLALNTVRKYWDEA